MSIDVLQDKIRKTKNPSVIDLTLMGADIPAHLLEEEGSVPKGYSRFCRELLEKLKGTKTTYPARYEITYSERTQAWQGAYEENPTKSPSEKVRSTRKHSCS